MSTFKLKIKRANPIKIFIEERSIYLENGRNWPMLERIFRGSKSPMFFLATPAITFDQTLNMGLMRIWMDLPKILAGFSRNKIAFVF